MWANVLCFPGYHLMESLALHKNFLAPIGKERTKVDYVFDMYGRVTTCTLCSLVSECSHSFRL